MLLGGGLACLSATQNREDHLIRLSREFNDNFRWQRFEMVAGAMPRAEGAYFLERSATVGEELTMADHEIMQIDIGPGSQSAKVTVMFQWYSKRDPVMRKTYVLENWDYKDGRWVVASMRRLRGDRFALVNEPPKLDSPDGGTDATPDAGT